MRLEDLIVYLNEYQFDELKRQSKPFAICLNDDRNLFETVLIYRRFTKTMMYLHSFAEKLLINKSTLSFIISLELNTDLLI